MTQTPNFLAGEIAAKLASAVIDGETNFEDMRWKARALAGDNELTDADLDWIVEYLEVIIDLVKITSEEGEDETLCPSD